MNVVTFTLPILESVVRAKRRAWTTRVGFLLAARRGDEMDYYVQALHEIIGRARDVGLELKMCIAVIRDNPLSDDSVDDGGIGGGPRMRSASEASEAAAAAQPGVALTQMAISEKGRAVESEKPPRPVDIESAAVELTSSSSPSSSPRRREEEGDQDVARRRGSADSHVRKMTSRPDVASFIREPVAICRGDSPDKLRASTSAPLSSRKRMLSRLNPLFRAM